MIRRQLLSAASSAFLAALAGCGAPQAPAPAPAPTPIVVVPVCAEGAADCDGDRANACETELQSSNAHCGACGNVCAAGDRCVAGACRKQRLISAYGRSACAILAGGVQCWGESLLRDGEALLRPVRVPEADGAVHISVGHRSACAVLPSGKVRCWGDGAVYELPGVDDAVEVEVGTTNKYVVTRDGRVKAFDGKKPTSLDPVRLEGVVSVASTLVFTCALHRSGETTCWGALPFIGAGPSAEQLDPAAQKFLEERGVKVVGLRDAVQITASDGTACALRKTGEVVCWGNLDRGKEDLANASTPVPVPGIADAVEVTLNEGDINYHHGCVVRRGGAVSCWGDAGAGATGSGDPTTDALADVKGLSDATGVTAGIQFSCANRASGQAACWGSAARGALGNGVISDPSRPQRVPGVSGATALGLGEDYSCALDAAGKITCWGGRDAYTTATKRGIPPRAVSAGPYKSLSPSTDAICALDAKGLATCFDPGGVAPAVTLSGLGPLRAVFREKPIGTALTRAGRVVLFGRDGASKQPIDGLDDAVSAAPATGFANVVCAVKKSGKVACAPYAKTLFDAPAAPGPRAGKPASPPRAVEVEGLDGAVAIVFGGPDFCVLHTTGDVTCFSSDSMRKAPSNKGAPARWSPKLERTTGVGGVALIGLRGAACAIRKDGHLVCWGSNFTGYLGLGDHAEHEAPTRVEGLVDVATAAAYPDMSGHTCAATRAGDVYCWGSGSSDQIGQEAPSYAFTPVAVLPPQ